MDRQQHSRAIQILARDLSVPEYEIQTIYETMLCNLKEGARIKDFLVILVSRNVKDMVENGCNRNLISESREAVEGIADQP